MIVTFSGAQSNKVPALNLINARKRLVQNKVQVYGLGAGSDFDPKDVIRTVSKGDFAYYKYKYEQAPSMAPVVAKAVQKGMEALLF